MTDAAEGEAKPRFKYRTLLFKKRWLTAGAVIILVAGVWIAREPIADEFISDQLDSRGVPASYTIERIGFRSEILSNIVIGDRSEERRVGEEWVRTGRSRWSPYH